MASEENHSDYLAARLLVEGKPVTYRLLSRALGVHVALAKRMLFDFHQKQNSTSPNSIHATYLISGTKQATQRANGTREGGDVAMRSSPPMSSLPEQPTSVEQPLKKTSIVLVREEELQGYRAQLELESSIHIYSLEPSPIENLRILATCNQEITTKHIENDPLNRWATYGSLHNPHIKRRTAKFAAPLSSGTSTSASQPASSASVAGRPQKHFPSTVRRGSASEDNTSDRATPQPPTNKAPLKRADSKSGAKKNQSAGDLFKSFAKAKPKTEDAATSHESTPVSTQDVPMQGMSEDEDDGQDEPQVKMDEEKMEAARRAKAERQEKLRQMMEDDDEDMPDAPSTNPPLAEAPQPEEVDEEPVVVENGRRRGKRRVMKKKKVKDEDGYLVTKEEAVWESFSEEEPEPKKAKPAPSRPSNSAAKGKAAGKKGQGSIASFFKKA